MNPALLPISFLLPIGFALIEWSARPFAELRQAALAAGVTAAVSAVAYFALGFAFQFGGVGLDPHSPAGLRALDKAWAPIPFGFERWSVIGLEGFVGQVDGDPAALTLVNALLLHRLPLAILSGLIPLLALGKHIPRLAAIASSIIASAIVFPITGAWIWGGGWLAALGSQLNFGHGAIDVAGAGIVYLSSGCIALVAGRLFAHSSPAPHKEPTLPAAPQPLLAIIGAPMFALGWVAWALSDPLLGDYSSIDLSGVAGIGLSSALAAAITVALYTWLIHGRANLLTIARAWLAGWIAVSACGLFVTPGATIVIGILAALLLIVTQYSIESGFGLTDRAGLLALCTGPGAWGLIALGLFADGAFGGGWNGVNLNHGVGGVLGSDPGQLTAQLAALAAIATLSLVSATLLLAPFSIVLKRRSQGVERSPEAPGNV
jgi:Amt family ammonium transporter